MPWRANYWCDRGRTVRWHFFLTKNKKKIYEGRNDCLLFLMCTNLLLTFAVSSAPLEDIEGLSALVLYSEGRCRTKQAGKHVCSFVSQVMAWCILRPCHAVRCTSARRKGLCMTAKDHYNSADSSTTATLLVYYSRSKRLHRFGDIHMMLRSGRKTI